MTASGSGSNAGIGANGSESGGTLVLNGGTVTATAANGSPAIACGNGSPEFNFNARVVAGTSAEAAAPAAVSDRAQAYRSPYARIEACLTHQADNGSCRWCGTDNPVNIALSGSGTVNKPYLIRSTADWNEMVRYTANGGTTRDVYFSQTADITAAQQLGTSEHPFEGHYDGNGKAIHASLSSSAEGCAPFSRIKGAEIAGVIVDGTVSAGGNFGSGLVGVISGGTTVIRNCLVETAINALAGYCGGVVGKGAGSVTLEGIAFTGSISGGSQVGVFWGWSDTGDAEIVNCLENGSFACDNMNPVGLGNTSAQDIDRVYCMHEQQGSPDRNWAGAGTRVYAIIPGEDITLEFVHWVPITYDVSGIEIENTTLMGFSGMMYSPENATVFISFNYTGTEWTWEKVAISPSAGESVYHTNDHSLYIYHMPAENVTIMAVDNSEIPDFDAKVEELDESNGQQDAVSAATNETLLLNLSSAFPSNIKKFYWYTLRFHVELEPGLTFKNVNRVYAGRSLPKKNNTSQTDYYWVNEAADHRSFDVYFVVGQQKLLRPGAQVSVQCKITTETGQAVSGKTGNLILASMAYETSYAYTRTHEASESEVLTASYQNGGFYGVHSQNDSALVFTHAVTIRTVDEDGAPLAGASYQLTRKSTGTTLYGTATEGGLVFNGMDDGEYILEQTDVPSGYAPIEPLNFIIVAQHADTVDTTTDREAVLQDVYVMMKDGTTAAEEDILLVNEAFSADDNLDLIGDITNRRIYTVTVAGGNPANGGTVTADRETACRDDMVTLTVDPNPGFELDSLNVTGAAGQTITLDNQMFMMPNANVTVAATWKPAWTMTGSGTSDDPYGVASAEHWNQLASAMENGFSMADRFFRLEHDISVTAMVGTADNPFGGTFDGNGYTLTFNANNADNGSPVAPFARTSGAVIRNLHVAGEVTGSKARASGLIGENGRPSQVVNCRVSVSISGTYYIGGFCVGEGEGIAFTGCVFDGDINAGGSSGGFAGWSNESSGLRFTDCLIAPVMYMAQSTFYYDNFSSDTQVLTNCYWLADSDIEQGRQAFSVTVLDGAAIDFGEGTVYDVSGITAYATGLAYNGVYYAGEGESVAVGISAGAAANCVTNGFSCSAGTLTGDGDTRTLLMPGEDVIVSAMLVPAQGSGTKADPWRINRAYEMLNLYTGWYRVSANASVGSRMAVKGEAHLTLAKGKTLTASQGINVSTGNTLTISGSGTLNAVGCRGCAGIGGGKNEDCGTVTINGGTVNATGSVWGAGIGGGMGGNGGNVTINGGNVTAQCYDPCDAEVGLAAGIGGGDTGNGGTILITGGTVYARGNRGSAGIGGGGYGSGGTITITGGTVTAIGASYPNGRSGAGIGAGRVRNNATSGDSGNITITGGTVIAMGGDNAQAIGLSNEVAGNDNGTLTIGAGLMVKAGNSESTAIIATGDPVAACRGAWAMIGSNLPFGSPDFTLPAFLTTVEEEAFMGAGMRVALVPSTCMSIGTRAFKDCQSLTQIRIPAGCVIGADAFEGCALVFVYGTAGSPAETYCAAHDNCVFVEE